VALLAFAASGCNAWRLFAIPHVRGEPASDRWIRIHHPELPISFEIPDNASGPLSSLWILGKDWPPEERPVVQRWGIRAVSREYRTFYALEFAFMWLTEETPGVDRSGIVQLAASLSEPEAVISFYREVYLTERPVEYLDLGPEIVGRASARRIDGIWLDERAYQFVVAPLGDDAVLVIGARFWHTATPEERDEIFPRIARSVRFDAGVLSD
jgi:hypothetical protein